MRTTDRAHAPWPPLICYSDTPCCMLVTFHHRRRDANNSLKIGVTGCIRWRGELTRRRNCHGFHKSWLWSNQSARIPERHGSSSSLSLGYVWRNGTDRSKVPIQSVRLPVDIFTCPSSPSPAHSANLTKEGFC